MHGGLKCIAFCLSVRHLKKSVSLEPFDLDCKNIFLSPRVILYVMV